MDITTSTTPLKLHIGCGKAYLPGFINVDIFSSVHADVYADLASLPFPRESFDLLYSSHCIEHCQRHTILSTLTHWRDLLKPGGILRLAVPDFAAAMIWYAKTGNLDDVMGLIFGGQTHPRNNHFVAFDSTTLKRDLIKVGFKDVRYWDWRTTDHAQFDDYSQATLPCDPITRKPIDKYNDFSVSLNMEATK
jgi:predicted SAM-dependent methyltransferase